MKKQKLLKVLMTGCLGVSLLAGCASTGSQKVEQSQTGGTQTSESTGNVETTQKEELVFVNYRDIRDLNPHLYAGEMYAQEMLFESLVNITEAGYEGCLAERWDISEEGIVYTFKIRPGVTFTDGERFEALAILHNFNSIFEE